MKYSQNLRSAFSLVELSIVLVILGLLVGGILGGKSLIKAAELRSISTEQAQWNTAIKAFRDKYFMLPGDMNNATQFWGAANAVPLTCSITASTDARTCDGNGDGAISMNGGGPIYIYEHLRAWQQMANAGLIAGQFRGYQPVGGSMGPYYAHSTNSPVSRFNKGVWTPIYEGTHTPNGADSVFYFQGEYGHVFILAAVQTVMGATFPADIISPADLWNVDTKVDDGKPGQGKLVAYSYTGLSQCTTAVGGTAAEEASVTADYQLTNETAVCSLAYRNQF